MKKWLKSCLAIVCVIAMLFAVTGCSKKDEKKEEAAAPAEQAATAVEEKAAEATEEAAAAVEEAAAAVEETASDAAEAAADAAEETAEAAGEAVEDAKETASEAVEAADAAVEETAEAAGEAVEAAKETASEAVEAADAAVEETAEAAGEAVEAAKETASEAVEAAGEAVEEAAAEATEAAGEAVEEATAAVEETAAEATEAVEEAAAAVEETADAATEAVEEAAAAVEETAAEATEAAGEAVEDAAAAVEETAAEATEAAGEAVEGAAAAVEETAAEATEAAGEAVEEAAAAVEETAAEATEAVEEAAAAAEETAAEATEAAGEAVEEAAEAVEETAEAGVEEAAAAVAAAGAAAAVEEAAEAAEETAEAAEEAAPAGKSSEAAPDWAEYDALIADIKTETDFAAREAKMHQAEDKLMETYAVIPLYHYNDLYMQRESVQGIYANLFGFKYFQYATVEGSDSLRLNLASEPDKLDPALNSSVDGACLAIASFGGLYTYDAEGQLKPDFATGYEVSEDGLTYTFTLRDGLKWSDGSDLTAKDFEYSWKRAANPQTGADYSYMFDGIKGYPEDLAVAASEDGKTLTVELKSPCAYMLDLMAFPAFYAVPQASVEAAEGWQENPGQWANEAGFVVSGPYMLTEWTHNQSMVYTKNPNYYDAENVKLETLSFMLSADDTAIYAAYQAGDVDFIDTVPTDEIQNLKGNPEFHIIDNLGTYYAAFNVNSKLFEGKTVEQANAMREAFSKLIDREYIIETVAQCEQKPANAFIPEGMADGQGGVFKTNDDAYTYPVNAATASGEELAGYYTFEVDEEGARELLKQAGYEFDDNGMLSANTPISIEYLTNESSSHVAIAECMQQDLAAVGIQMSIRTCDWNVFLQDRKKGLFDFAREGWLADFNDPINMLEMWTTDSGNNDCQFGR